MKIVVNFLNNQIDFDNNIFSIEVENKIYLFRIIQEFNKINNGELSDVISVFDNKYNEINIKNKFDLYFDFFNLDINNKKIHSKIYEHIINNLSEEDNVKIINHYNKIMKIFNKELSNLNLDLNINEEILSDNIIKNIKIKVEQKDSLLDNILQLIDINTLFKLNEFSVFINLKQYLSKIELIELYKYAVYNGVNILLIDSYSYGPTLFNEKKLIIDNDLNEFMI